MSRTLKETPRLGFLRTKKLANSGDSKALPTITSFLEMQRITSGVCLNPKFCLYGTQ
jgi:hypothetical protein